MGTFKILNMITKVNMRISITAIKSVEQLKTASMNLVPGLAMQSKSLLQDKVPHPLQDKIYQSLEKVLGQDYLLIVTY